MLIFVLGAQILTYSASCLLLHSFRLNQAGDGFGKLEVVRHLLGYDAHSPTARSIDSGGSYASSSQPMTVSSSTHVNTISSSTASSRHKRRQRLQHSCK
jgi:hypothetical protein